MRTSEGMIKNARELRRSMSLPELLLWGCLRGGQLRGRRFRRQHPVGRFVLDFYCAAAKLAIEVDGAHHDLADGLAADARRDKWLAERGIATLRIPATDVLDDHLFEGVLTTISSAIEGRMNEFAVMPPPPPPAVPLPRFAGEEPARSTALDCSKAITGGDSSHSANLKALRDAAISSPAKRGRGTAGGGGGGAPNTWPETERALQRDGAGLTP